MLWEQETVARVNARQSDPPAEQMIHGLLERAGNRRPAGRAIMKASARLAACSVPTGQRTKPDTPPRHPRAQDGTAANCCAS